MIPKPEEVVTARSGDHVFVSRLLDELERLRVQFIGATEPDEVLPSARAWADALLALATDAPDGRREGLAMLADLLRSLATLLDANERRFLRLGFDLHDGALQHVAVAAMDARLLGDRLSAELAGTEQMEPALGAVGDFEATLAAVDRELRELAHSYGSPSVLTQPLGDALRAEAEFFGRQTGARLALDLEGDFTALTQSQQITVLRFMQSALGNVRQHSRARGVQVKVACDEKGIHASVRDDGQGFDVEQTLARAAASGHLGLVSMAERIRLLSGEFRVDSRPGGPTTISMRLPPWRPGAQ